MGVKLGHLESVGLSAGKGREADSWISSLFHNHWLHFPSQPLKGCLSHTLLWEMPHHFKDRVVIFIGGQGRRRDSHQGL